MKKTTEFKYMLLGRCLSDLKYYFGISGRGTFTGYYGNLKEHMKETKNLFIKLNTYKEIEWTNIEEINMYENLVKEQYRKGIERNREDGVIQY